LKFSSFFNKIRRNINLKAICISFVILCAGGRVNSQIFPSIALAGGLSVGWYFNPVKDLNNELRNAGFPEFKESGFFTIGGGGFIDFPLKNNFFRVGGFGTGFSSKQDKKYNDTLTKAANYSLGMGGLVFEYVRTFTSVFDVHIGAQFATGNLRLELYQYGSSYGNYGSILGELGSNGTTSNISRVFTSRIYSVQPQLGIGVLVKKFFYIKLDAGYQLSSEGAWKVDDEVEVQNFPSGITAKGFIINLSLNLGLFIRED